MCARWDVKLDAAKLAFCVTTTTPGPSSVIRSTMAAVEATATTLGPSPSARGNAVSCSEQHYVHMNTCN